MTQAQLSTAFAKVETGRRERLTRIARTAPFEKPVVLTFPLAPKDDTDRAMASAGNTFNPWMPQG